jgi:hypothetical protein
MRLVVAAVVAGMLSPAIASAIELGKPRPGSALSGATLNVNQSLYYKWNVFLDDDPEDSTPPPFQFHEFVSRTRAEFKINRFTVGAQMDWVALTPNCSQEAFRDRFEESFPDTGCVSPNPLLGTGDWGVLAQDHFLFQMEKMWLSYRGKNAQFEVGDFYAAFGRGLVLNMLRKPEIDIDNSIRGARFDVLTKRFDMTLLGGITNPQEVSMELRNLQVSKTDFRALAGARFLFRPAKGFEIGAHGVGYDLEAADKSGSVGGLVAANGLADGALDLFMEGDAFLYGDGGEDVESALAGAGYGLYGTLTAFAGPVTLLVEGKRYKNAFGYVGDEGFPITRMIQPGPVVPLQYNLPPTLEHELSVTPDVNKAIQSLDITGWRAQADLWLLMSDTTLTVAFGNSFEAQPHPGFSEQREITIHPSFELRQPIRLSDNAELSLVGDVGYRHDFPWRFGPNDVPDRIAARDGWQDEFLSNVGLLHYRADVGLTVGKHSWELVSTYRRQHRSLPSEICWQRNGAEHCDKDDGWIAMENSLSYTLMGKYTVAVNVDFTDDVRVQSLAARGARGNLFYDREFRSSAYIGGTVILKPASWIEVNVFGGSQKAGIVCTGGACRTVPAFTGLKGRVTLNF